MGSCVLVPSVHAQIDSPWTCIYLIIVYIYKMHDMYTMCLCTVIYYVAVYMLLTNRHMIVKELHTHIYIQIHVYMFIYMCIILYI